MEYNTIISAAELGDLVASEHVRIFDCRFSLKDPQGGLKNYKSGHIPGAQFADMDTQLSSPMTETSGRHPLPNADVFIEQLKDWGVNNATQVIAYDDISGAFAARMWWMMRWVGHTKVAVLDGGLQKWLDSGNVLEKEIPQFPRGTFSGHANMQWLIDLNSVRKELDASNITLIDARAADRFTGKDQKTDPVPGHIPGAKNLPFGGNLNKDGMFLSADQIRDRFNGLVQGESIERVVNMCGSGVTACHNLLALEIAGFDPSRIFIGSWSQWIRDASRPVATGEET